MKNKINPRSFTMIKFLLTLGLIFNYSISLVSVIDVFKSKNNNLLLNTKTYLAVQLLLFISAIISILIFFLVRKDVNKKLSYKYNKKEKKLIYIICFLVALIFLISLVNLLMFLFLFKNIIIMIFTFLIIQLLLGIGVSILESYSRLTEQALVNKLWFNNEENTQNVDKTSKTETKVLDKKDDFNPFMEENND
ncbi:hypothetical protein [Spiroplasma floricola]|uniref:Transmembrane protein n=1 Tax=Spiroplasma floricola 23-6 TaxID=1336749 RepID=A0A2K8SDM3_9MOLU|nr:hypothetical protein [Spiroplasma floricola]AUB31523.1 hypothetical protein SFLOR_v1c04710 [Spiroplasma floricola 23-6]